MSKAYDASVEALSYEPAPQRTYEEIITEVYEDLCEMVAAGDITVEEGNMMMNLWREEYGR
ncbi:MAG: hypothetical protein NVS1B10_08860 [Candidatus Saccharimonadales bacterium]